MRNKLIRRLIAVAVATGIGTSSHAVTAVPGTLIQYRSLAVAPDGSRIASVDSLAANDTALPDTHGIVVVRDPRTGTVIDRLDPCPACSYAGLTWSPDGHGLAFVATDGKAATADVVVANTGTIRTLTSVHGTAQTPRWSADGRQVAFLAVEGAHKAIGAVEAGRAQVGQIGEADDEQRIAVVAAEGGPIRFVSPADTFVYEYDWVPDGRSFVATAATGNGDNNWWVAKLVAVDAVTGSIRTIAAPAMQIAAPHVAANGSTVVFIGGLMSDFGVTGGDLYSVPLIGGAPHNHTVGHTATITSLTTTGSTEFVTRQNGDRLEIDRISFAVGAKLLDPLWSRPVRAEAGDAEIAVAADGSTIASVISDFAHPAEINVGTLGAGAFDLRPLTTGNADHTPHLVARSLNWKSEGRTVQGWLLTPLDMVAGKAPMIVQIHGGPSSSWTPSYVWNGTDMALLARGYALFRPNPRGSYGQGEAFTRANIRDFGGGDLRDIQTGIDTVLKTAPIDGNRLGVYGHSYGGFMAMWTVTHSNRFKTAVAGAGIANWISYYGQNGIDQWMIPFFGASAYDDPAVYIADSPLTTIKAAKTPTLIYVGERDVECPPAQSVEFWHGLKEMGVPTSLVIYEGAGHRIRKPEQIHDREDRVIAWFDRWLK